MAPADEPSKCRDAHAPVRIFQQIAHAFRDCVIESKILFAELSQVSVLLDVTLFAVKRLDTQAGHGECWESQHDS
jgi:hypothetical protein